MAHLLVVDDDTALREKLAETLQGLGHSATEVGSGMDALAALRSGRFDAVFLDHRMPGMDGLQTLAAMKAQLARVPPVIVLTAYASGGNTIDAMRLGAFDHLTKPIRRDAVIEVLARALRSDDAAAIASVSASISETDDDDDALVGPSDAMREVHKRIVLAAAIAAPVLVLG
ncbi:hypothetical protein BH10PSE18_BH10PSE18_30950 [soil metagenome]